MKRASDGPVTLTRYYQVRVQRIKGRCQGATFQTETGNSFMNRYTAFSLGLAAYLVMWYNPAKAQDTDANFVISAKIYDVEYGHFLPNVAVVNSSTGNQTTSTSNGDFRLEGNREADSIYFSAVGFVKLGYKASELRDSDSIGLFHQANILDEFVVLSDKSVLYRMIERCRANQEHESTVARCYSEIESTIGNEQAELIQGYYNSYFSGGELTDLHTKNVRVGFRPKNGWFFTSLGISKIFYEHRLFIENDLFPGNPLNYKPSKLRRLYDLFLNGKYLDNGRTVYVISFSPSSPDSTLFSGTFWIDSADATLQQVVLEGKNLARYPFESIRDYDLISGVDLKITKAFERSEKGPLTRFIDFTYSYSYRTRLDTQLRIQTHATLTVFDREKLFAEPVFHFSKERELSRLISELYITEYDPVFWNCMTEYKSSADRLRSESFYSDSLTLTNDQILYPEKYREGINALGGLYQQWNADKRIYLRDMPVDTTIDSRLQGGIPSELYQLTAQIYLNITNDCDSTYFVTKTLFDPFNTYYHYPQTVETMVFINLYFDIVELQRRKLNVVLSACDGNITAMMDAYKKSQEETDKLTRQFFAEVNRGQDKRMLRKWNDYVFANLGIDNITWMMGK